MTVTVTRLVPHVSLPRYETAGAAAFDLAAAADVEVPPRGIRLVPTGLVVQVPAGYFLAILARSSTPLKRGLMVANGVGVVDSDYCGPADEVKIQVINVTDAPVTVQRGDRIAQGMVLAAPRVSFVEGAAEGPSRGGFGSTGH
ncbi:MAG: dUTP diphosphatase [Vicinamibacterales bacterium]